MESDDNTDQRQKHHLKSGGVGLSKKFLYVELNNIFFKKRIT